MGSEPLFRPRLPVGGPTEKGGDGVLGAPGVALAYPDQFQHRFLQMDVSYQ